MSKRAAIYARVSTDMQRDNFSIPTQVAECVRFVKTKGYSLVGNHFVDPETGLDVPAGNRSIPAYVDDITSREMNRPNLDAALSFLEDYGYDVIVIHAIDRLARDPYIRQTLEKDFAKLGAKVEYALGNYEETPEGDVRKDLDATFAKWENARRVERSTRGKRGKAQKGLFVGGRTPYGYNLDPQAPGGLAINDDQADVVRRIFTWYVDQGLSFGAIAKKLNQYGAITSSGREKWQKSTVSAMLKNTAYIGRVYYNKYECKSNNNRSVRNHEEWIKILITPLVDEATFEAAQQLMADNRESLRRQPTHSYLLTGMVRCAECERPYRVNFRNARPEIGRREAKSYKHRTSEGHCLNREMSARQLDPLVWEEIQSFLLEPGSLRMGYQQALELERSNHARQRTLQTQYYGKIGKLEKQLQNLNAIYTDPDVNMTKSEYLTQRNLIENELKSVGDQIQAIDAQLSDLPTPEEYDNLEKFAEDVKARIDNEDWEPTQEIKRRILELLHVKVLVSKDRTVQVTGWFGELPGVSYKLCSHFVPLGLRRARS
jgi:site-specific DNA recombinase